MSRIQPPLTELTAPYWQGCREGELRLQRCTDCDQHQFYPRTICSHCGSAELAWDRVSGRGSVASFTTVRRAISDAYEAPYVVALIQLEEGPVMMSTIVDTKPEQVSVGATVTVGFERWSEDTVMPVVRMTANGG